LPTQKTVDFGNTTSFEAIGTNAYGPLEWLPADWSAEAGKGSIDLDGRFTADKFSGKIYGNGTSTSQCHITAILDGHTAHATVLVQLHNNTDHDDDGILDWQELSVGLNPFNSSDAAEDYDSDWLTNAQEVELGTLLNNNDTDGDYLSDAFEIVFSKTSPTEPDSDHDGVTDGVEFAATHNYSAKLTLTPSGSYGMDITWGDHTFHAETSSVVRDADFNVKERRLTLNLSGKLTSDYLNFSIPTDLCDMEDIVLTIDGVQVHPSAKLVEGFYEVSYEYPSGSHEIVLEFASDGALPAVYWLLLAVVLALGITVAILLVRRSKGS
jgi:hypothetical protein